MKKFYPIFHSLTLKANQNIFLGIIRLNSVIKYDFMPPSVYICLNLEKEISCYSIHWFVIGKYGGKWFKLLFEKIKYFHDINNIHKFITQKLGR